MKINSKKFLDELMKCKDCQCLDNGQTWQFCDKHWNELKQFRKQTVEIKKRFEGYSTHFYCKKCGAWILKSEIKVYDKLGRPLCPNCKCGLRHKSPTSKRKCYAYPKPLSIIPAYQNETNMPKKGGRKPKHEG